MDGNIKQTVVTDIGWFTFIVYLTLMGMVFSTLDRYMTQRALEFKTQHTITRDK